MGDMIVVDVSLVTLEMIALNFKLFGGDLLLSLLIVTGRHTLMLFVSHDHMTQGTWLCYKKQFPEL